MNGPLHGESICFPILTNCPSCCGGCDGKRSYALQLRCEWKQLVYIFFFFVFYKTTFCPSYDRKQLATGSCWNTRARTETRFAKLDSNNQKDQQDTWQDLCEGGLILILILIQPNISLIQISLIQGITTLVSICFKECRIYAKLKQNEQWKMFLCKIQDAFKCVLWQTTSGYNRCASWIKAHWS